MRTKQNIWSGVRGARYGEEPHPEPLSQRRGASHKAPLLGSGDGQGTDLSGSPLGRGWGWVKKGMQFGQIGQEMNCLAYDCKTA
ncbi:MAG: hypothetical protein A2Y71_00715 [Bacteroidetes bacterium RBG_13_42_15]|nr:MAG: hypothetical protein A2Y71_00715 [Bacteroidetes bacterium RBG_13_42_15]